MFSDLRFYSLHHQHHYISHVIFYISHLKCHIFILPLPHPPFASSIFPHTNVYLHAVLVIISDTFLLHVAIVIILFESKHFSLTQELHKFIIVFSCTWVPHPRWSKQTCCIAKPELSSWKYFTLPVTCAH